MTCTSEHVHIRGGSLDERPCALVQAIVSQLGLAAPPDASRTQSNTASRKMSAEMRPSGHVFPAIEVGGKSSKERLDTCVVCQFNEFHT